MNEQERMVRIMGESKETKKMIQQLQIASSALGMSDWIEGTGKLKDEALDLQAKINNFIKKVR